MCIMYLKPYFVAKSIPDVMNEFFCFRTGSDRSSMFVALSILIQQLRIEKKLDVCTVARKLRAQRPGMLQTFVS